MPSLTCAVLPDHVTSLLFSVLVPAVSDHHATTVIPCFALDPLSLLIQGYVLCAR